MPLTQQEIERFQEFAASQAAAGGVASLEECLRLWREAQARQEAINDIQEGLDDEAAGRMRPFLEVDAEIRRRHGFAVSE